MQFSHGIRARSSSVALFVLSLGLSVLLLGGAQAQAETGQKALILSSSVLGGTSSTEATNAAGNGFAVTVASDAAWNAMTAAQFADYQLIIVGDNASFLPAAVSQNATALADAVMARAGGNTKVGNRMLIGTDPRGHLGSGGSKLIETGIDFVGVQDGASNLYLTFSDQDRDYDFNGVPDAQQKLLPKLTIDPASTWTQNRTPPCGGSVSLIANAAQFSTLTTTHLQGWGCSVHETFPKYPTDWTPLAIATDTTTRPTCGTDVTTGATRCGEAYVLIAGSGIVVEAPDLGLTPATAAKNVGDSHTVTAKVTNPDGTDRSGVAVSFVITGANAGAAGTCVPVDCKSNTAGEVAYTYTGAAAGDDTINATITVDGSRQTATAAATWTAVTNRPPLANAGGPYNADEGGSTTLDGSGSSDPDGDALTYSWDLDGDGTHETPGQSPTFSAAGLDNGIYAVELKVCDPSGDCDTAAGSVTVHNVAPTVDAGADQTVYRNEVVNLSGSWTDPAGALDNPYAWTWAVPGDPSNSTASYGTALDRTASFATEGTYTLTLSVTDDDGATGSDEIVVTVLNRDPSCSDARPSVAELWSPNHKFVAIGVLGLTDAEGDTLTVEVTGIHQDEAVNDAGDGTTAPDGKGVGTATAEVRSERSGTGDGRVYHIAFRVTDGHGGSCTGTVKVSVPHDQASAAVDGGPLHDSTVQ